jgi:hypothetical protein
MNDNIRHFKCAVDGCDKPASINEAGNYYCALHAWQMLRRYG